MDMIRNNILNNMSFRYKR